jgi:hypothetical protein
VRLVAHTDHPILAPIPASSRHVSGPRLAMT